MKIKKGFVLREVPGMNVVMPTGENVRTFKGALVLNESGVTFYKTLENGADRAQLVAALLAKYDADEATIAADVDEMLQSFREAGILED